MNELINTRTKSKDYLQYRQDLNYALTELDPLFKWDSNRRGFPSLELEQQEELALGCALSSLDCDFFHDYWIKMMEKGEQIKDPECLFLLKSIRCKFFSQLSPEKQMDLYDFNTDLIEAIVLGLIGSYKDEKDITVAPSFIVSIVIDYYLHEAGRDYDQINPRNALDDISLPLGYRPITLASCQGES